MIDFIARMFNAIIALLRDWLIKFFSIVLLTCAVILLIIHSVLPLANQLREPIIQILTQQLGVIVSLEKINLHFHGWKIKATLKQIQLSELNTNKNLLAIQKAEFNFDILTSLKYSAPRLNTITLVGADLQIKRSQDGQINILGLTAWQNSSSGSLAHFLRYGRFILLNSKIDYRDEKFESNSLVLNNLQFDLINKKFKHYCNGSAQLIYLDFTKNSQYGLQISWLADLTGPPKNFNLWNGLAYTNITLNNFTWERSNQTVQIKNLQIESWHDITLSQITKSVSNFKLDNLSLLTVYNSTPLIFNHISAIAKIKVINSNLHIQIADLAIKLENNLEFNNFTFITVFNFNTQKLNLIIQAPQLILSDLIKITKAQNWPMPIKLSNLHGTVNNLKINLSLNKITAPRWSINAQLTKFGCDPNEQLPGLDNLDAEIQANQSGGELNLNANHSRLIFPAFFAEPIDLININTKLEWSRQKANIWQLKVNNFKINTQEFGAQAEFTLKIPHQFERSWLELQAHFYQNDTTKLNKYLPIEILKPKLRAWLARAIGPGQIPEATLTWHGALADFPFRKQEGRFELRLAFQDLRLQYAPNWPPIEAAAGFLHFINQKLTIQIERGRIYESILSIGRTEIEDLWGVEQLAIHGETLGPFTDAVRVLAESSLADDFGRLARSLQVTGAVQIMLDLDIFLNDEEQIDVRGQLSWPQLATLGIKNTEILFKNFTGQVNFTNKTITSNDFKAQLWDQAAQIFLTTIPKTNLSQSSSTQITVHSKTNINQLKQIFPHRIWDFLHGQFDWNLITSFQNNNLNQLNIPIDYQLTSNCRTVSVDLPPPIEKLHGITSDLKFTGTFIPENSLNINGKWGELATHLTWGLKTNTPKLIRGQLRFGAQTAPESNQNGLILDGTINELNPIAWREFFKKFNSNSSNYFNDQTSKSFIGAHLKITKLPLVKITLTNTQLDINPYNEGWEAQIQSNEAIGHLLFPTKTNQQPLDFSLKYLDLRPFWQTETNSQITTKDYSNSNSDITIPAVNLTVDQLYWDNILLGTAKLKLRHTNHGLRVSPLLIKTPTEKNILTGNAEWSTDDLNNSGQSQLSINLNLTDHDLIKNLLAEQDALETNQFQAKLKLNWNGDFTAFEAQKTDGAMTLKMGTGRLRSVNPGVGKLLGILNLNALGKRLALDFSDLYGKGFAFEQITGQFSLNTGKAYCDNLTVQGLAGKILINGWADLINHQLNQIVIVEPRISTSVALASAVAGGPVVGAAVYLVDRVAGNPIDRLSRYRYQITGTWTQPVWRKIGWETFQKPIINQLQLNHPRNLFLDTE